MRNNLYKILLTVSITFAFLGIVSVAAAQQFYEVRTYYISSPDQQERLDAYLQKALVPALHRNGIQPVGVFKPVADTGARKVVVFIPFKKAKQFFELNNKLEKDANYISVGKEFIDAAYDKPLYKRMEKTLLKAFDGMPKLQKPALNAPVANRVYELRSYEAATEKLSDNKIAMFNNGEIGIFKKLDFHPIFFAKVLAGKEMPNLMYMTSFESMEEREKHWKAFGSDPDWKKLSSMSQYDHNFLRADVYLLKATSYSDL